MPSYVYGVVPASAGPPAEAGIGGAEVALFAIDDQVALLHSHLDADAVQPRRAHLTAHDRVLAAAMGATPVLPLRFGIVTDLDRDRIRGGLDVPAVLERMKHLDGRVEVQVLWTLDEDAALRRVAEAVPAVRDTSLPAVDRGRAVAETMTELAITDLQRILARLQAHVVDHGPVESRGTASARVAVLVDVGDLDQVVADCGRLADEVATVGSLRTVAGLPPYTFADLGLDLAGV